MQNDLYIPKRLKVGFVNRADTFTGKLAYVIYYDDKGVLRKETSWKNWCDPKIPAVELDNVPTKFLFNKGVDRNGHFGSGRSLMRVYDERDFEFEISIDNLVGILMHSDISKRDIVEPCVLAWAGKDLVLLPINSDAYQASVAYTKKQGDKVSSKSLVKGYSYTQKKEDKPLIYIGYYNWYEWVTSTDDYDDTYFYNNIKNHTDKGKKHIFYDGHSFMPYNVSNLSSVCTSDVCDNYADLVDAFLKTEESSPVCKYELCDKPILTLSQHRPVTLYMLENDILISVSVAAYNDMQLDSVILSSATKLDTRNGRVYFLRDGSGQYLVRRDRSYRIDSVPGQVRHRQRLKDLAATCPYMQKYLNSDEKQNFVPKNVMVQFLIESGFKYLVVENELGCKFDHTC